MKNLFKTILAQAVHGALFFLAGCAGSVWMASCSSDSPIADAGQDELKFDASVAGNWTSNSLTRATATTLATLEKFYVTAIGNGTNFFTDLEVRKTTDGDSDATWAYIGEYYWPGYTLRFFAYAPTTLTGASISNSSQTISYTPASAGAEQQDFVVAYNSYNVTEGSVALNFKHALSQIEVQALNASPTTMQVEVVGVKLSNAVSASTFRYAAPGDASSYALSTATNWPASSATATADYEISPTSGNTDGEVITLTSDAQPLMFGNATNTDNWMLIPQTSTAWAGGTTDTGVYLSVLCRITDLTHDLLLWPDTEVLKEEAITTIGSGSDAKTYAYSAVPLAITWEPGRKYTYTLNFFTEGNGGGQVEPGSGSIGNDGDTVVCPITVTATVTEWADGGEVGAELL
ncbi:MAG: fimbrillin family protein [Bacteroides sp.]|nr:fimbrillin family protein [Bacteroides sp.]